MARLTLLLPATPRFSGVALPPALGRPLARADRIANEPGEPAQLARHVDVLPRQWAAAPLTRLLDSGEEDARLGAWLRADPAWIRPDINGARLLGIGAQLGLEQADVDAFLPALRPLFGDAGLLLDAPVPGRWYLRLPHEARLPVFASPDEALGDDVFDHDLFDAGRGDPEARRWRVLASEAQVVLHNHPRNAERAAASKVPVNALWFWGGGLLPDHVDSRHPTVFSDDLRLHGLARLGRFKAMPLAAMTGFEDGVLVDLRDQRDSRDLVEHWLLPAVASGQSLVLDFADGVAFSLEPAQRWRFWRRPLSSPA